MKYRSLLLTPVFILAACGGGGGGSSIDRVNNDATEEVSIAFQAVVGDQAVACGVDYANLGTANSIKEFTDFRFYVHDLYLITREGDRVAVVMDTSDWQAEGVALLDFEDASGACSGGTQQTNARVTGTVPKSDAEYTGVAFTLGVPEELNHLDSATSPSPLNVIGLHWSWTNGYKFIRLDIPGWNIHLGSTNCDGPNGSAVCTNKNRPAIELDNFDPETQAIMLDYAALVQGNNVAIDIDGAPGCMSGKDDPECNAVFTQLGLNLASGEVDTGLQQTVFSVTDQ